MKRIYDSPFQGIHKQQKKKEKRKPQKKEEVDWKQSPTLLKQKESL